MKTEDDFSLCVIHSTNQQHRLGAQIMRAIRILRSHGMDDAVTTRLPFNGDCKTDLRLAPGVGSPLHRTGNALKLFSVAVVDKICTPLTSPQ